MPTVHECIDGIGQATEHALDSSSRNVSALSG
jgi:hypothetical protein